MTENDVAGQLRQQQREIRDDARSERWLAAQALLAIAIVVAIVLIRYLL